MEAEQVASANVPVAPAGWGRTEFLSGGTWLQIQIDAEQVDEQVPAEGVVLRYRFAVPAPADYEVWNRVGYEFARSPFDWRLDDGDWQRVGPEELTTDLMELQEWNEVAWLRLGERRLSRGEHALEIRLPRTVDAEGKPQRVLYASDLICLYPGRFHPNGQHKPGEPYRTAIDAQAGGHVFSLPEPGRAGERVRTSLAGLWEVCRHDEQLPGPVAAPMTDLPEQPHWTAIPVPGDRNSLRPDLIFAHRLWYRTRFEVPRALQGRSFFIVFPQNNLNTTVYVNGVLCGFQKNPFCRFSIDITRGVRPGVNELVVGIRDAWYGFSANPDDPLKLRRKFNLPLRFSTEGFQDLAYPVWNHFQSGILFTPELIAAGPVYVADAFCRPSVAQRTLRVDLTLANPSDRACSGELRWEAVDDASGQVAKRFRPRPYQVPPRGETTLSVEEAWSDPVLWWPNEGHLYRLRATLVADGRPVDVTDQTFGFREWGIDDRHFTLNGVRWHGWADTHTAPDPEQWLRQYRDTDQRMMRLWGMSWYGMSPDEALSFFDRHGVVVRRSGLLDGQRIGYMAIEQDEDLKRRYGSEIKMELMQNWRDQIVAQVKGERNHPSVMVWSLENEWLYINCINLYGGLMDEFEREVTRVSDAVRTVDPTRPTMVDGGGATRAQTLPVHGDHYVFAPGDTRYPDLAYQANPRGGGRGRWEWDQQRPRFLGEDYFANGINPADYAMFGGEAAFLGKAQARPAAGLIYRMLTEGYRWAEYGAWHFWMTQNEAVDQYGSNAWLAAFCREWDWTFGSEEQVHRTVGVFNDTRFDDPVTFAWTLMVGGETLASWSWEGRVAPGAHERLNVSLPMPAVRERTEAELVLSLRTRGEEVFRDVKAVSVLPFPAAPPVGVRLTAADGRELVAEEVLVWDPHGRLRGLLDSLGITMWCFPIFPICRRAAS